MIYTSLSNVLKAVRLRYAIPFVLLLTAVYLTVIHPWMRNWGSTEAEQQMALPGDDLIPHLSGKTTKAITIYAPSDIVWQWLVQIGQGRAGFYSYDWLANLTGADIHSADEIHPEWQHLTVRDGWRTVPANYLGGVGKDAASPVLMIEPGRVLVLEMFGAHVLLPIGEGSTRLIVRGESGPSNFLMTMIVDPIVFTMERRMLLGLKARAEGRPDAPATLTVIAPIGWISAGIIVAALFVIERRRRFWLALPVVASLPALLMSHDFQAGLAAFLAAGISILGFLFFGRNWWGSLLVIGSLVLLTLLLAQEAYVAIGLAFALLLLAALVAMVAARSNILDDAARHVVTPTR
jgi:hypothetical protein